MRELEQFADPEMIPCKVCKEIPISEAVNEEAVDCVLHFCGLECYAMERPGRGPDEHRP
jgi:hypothetical protein